MHEASYRPSLKLKDANRSKLPTVTLVPLPLSFLPAPPGCSRLVDLLRTAVLAVIPPRWWQDLIEIPVLLVILFSCAKVIVLR